PKYSYKPTRLKCNYNIYVNSYLKPFKYKANLYTNIQFGSIACLLRHKRESYRIYSYSFKPYLYTHKDCKQSALGNKFLRRYNLLGHIKRAY
ncbi:hypothetical protein K432DRAFT_251792, partial [Lepidopterella palustris CBS 459.81]